MTIKYIALNASAIFDSRIKPHHLKLLAVIAFYGSLSGREAYPSYNRLCKDMGISDRRSIMRSVKYLCDCGYLKKRLHLRPNGSKTTNIYEVTLNVIIAPSLGDEAEKEAGGQSRSGSFHHLQKVDDFSKQVVVSQTTTPDGLPDHLPDGLPDHLHNNSSLLIKRKNNNKKTIPSDKVSLAEWEEGRGARLCVEMIGSWIKDARANPSDVAPLIEEFRDKVQAQGKVYADFAAAFKVWLRNGWLSRPLGTIILKGSRLVSGEAELWDRGSAL